MPGALHGHTTSIYIYIYIERERITRERYVFKRTRKPTKSYMIHGILQNRCQSCPCGLNRNLMQNHMWFCWFSSSFKYIPFSFDLASPSLYIYMYIYICIYCIYKYLDHCLKDKSLSIIYKYFIRKTKKTLKCNPQNTNYYYFIHRFQKVLNYNLKSIWYKLWMHNLSSGFFWVLTKIGIPYIFLSEFPSLPFQAYSSMFP